jgi:HK97 family phage prohead protease
MPSFLKVKSAASTSSAKILRIGGKKHAAPTAPFVPKPDALKELLGKAVFFESEGERVAGKAVRVDGDKLVINLAVPSRDGVLMVTDSEITVKASDLEVTKALMQQKRVRMFEAGADITLAEDSKSVPITEPVPGDDKATRIVDYRDVVIEGYASTFVGTTERDRGGDYVLPGAFDKTLTAFRKNPVMLIDHRNSVDHLAGSWEKLDINARGLAVRGKISNAPGLRDLRYRLVEGHLKGLSIGGIWYYKDDGYGIEEAELFEISLTPVPMNPDSLAMTRSLGVADCRKAFAKFWRSQSTLKAA